MEWLSELLKHITISRSFTGAVFITSASLISGPKLLPTYFEPLPKEWAIPTLGALIFTGALLFFWFIPAIWRLCINIIIFVLRHIRSKNLTEAEHGLMLLLAHHADESLNLRTLNYSESLTKLEVLELSSSLSSKGFVNINPWDENIITLSSEGRRRAIEMNVKSRQQNHV